MKLTSPPIGENNHNIPSKYTCDGVNISPPLEIDEVPERAKSLVLIMDDPDAPGGTLNHWIVWNISPVIKKIKKNSIPTGAIVGKNAFGENNYIGPCPPADTHAYLFKLYAIDALLPIDSTLGKKEIRRAIEGHILEKTLFKGYYRRVFSEML